MEFEYCDRCGEMLPAQNRNVECEEVLCASCQLDSSTPQPPGLMDSVPMSTSSPTTGQAENPQFTLTGVMKADGLDLFSNETLALRKKKMVEPKKSKLRIVDESTPVEEPAPSPFTPSTPPAPSSDEPSDFLGLGKDPASTVFGASLPPNLVDPREIPLPASGQPQEPPAPQPRTAQPISSSTGEPRWQVECLFCAAKLALPQVERKSKLRCPRCTEFLVIEPNGRVRAPKPGSIAVPKNPDTQFDLLEKGPGGSEVIRRRVQARNQNPIPAPAPRPGGSVAPRPGSVAVTKAAPMGPAPAETPPTGLSESSLFGSVPTTTSTADRPASSPFGDLTAQPSPSVGTLTMDPPSRRTTSEELVAPVAPPMEVRDHASALLGTKDSGEFRCPSHRAPGDLTADHIVLWILVAALPTFAGLLFASGVMGPRVQQVLMAIGESAGLM